MEEDVFNKEFGRKFLALIRAGFKVSDLISDPVLRVKIKTQILNVYKLFCGKNYSELLKEIDVLDNYLFLAGQMNLIKENHLRILENGFLIFKSRIILLNNTNDTNKNTRMTRIENDVPEYKEKPASAKSEKLSERQEKITKYFQEHNEMKLSDLIGFFPGISRKTLGNDLSRLVELGKITRQGNRGSGSFYRIVGK